MRVRIAPLTVCNCTRPLYLFFFSRCSGQLRPGVRNIKTCRPFRFRSSDIRNVRTHCTRTNSVSRIFCGDELLTGGRESQLSGVKIKIIFIAKINYNIRDLNDFHKSVSCNLLGTHFAKCTIISSSEITSFFFCFYLLKLIEFWSIYSV